MVIDFIGWLGAFLLATCGIPQLVHTVRTRSFKGLSLIFILWWTLGEILVIIYAIHYSQKLPLILNYAMNIFICTVILYIYFQVKIKPRFKKTKEKAL
jgi:uncharacterized protein with PQ loop repeat